VLGATTTGALVALHGGSFVAALVLSGVLGLVGAFSYLVIVQRIEPLPTTAAPADK
jgi:MFS transporter, ACS family, D-galactonate transporter